MVDQTTQYGIISFWLKRMESLLQSANTDKEQSVKAYRMRQHFQKCAVQPASSDSTLTPPKRKREDSEECENTTEERDGVAATPAKRFCVQSDIQQHIFKTSGTTKDIQLLVHPQQTAQQTGCGKSIKDSFFVIGC